MGAVIAYCEKSPMSHLLTHTILSGRGERQDPFSAAQDSRTHRKEAMEDPATGDILC